MKGSRTDMRKTTLKVLTAAAATAAGVALAAAPASALPLSISMSPSSGTVSATNNGAVAGLDLNTHSALVCQNSSASATLDASTPPKVAELTSVLFSQCLANGNIISTVTANNLPWNLEVTGTTSGTTTPGKLTGVSFTLHSDNPLCTAVVSGPNGNDGYVVGNSTDPVSTGDPSKLTLPTPAPGSPPNNNLEVTSAISCPTSLIQVGDKVTLSGTYDVTPGITLLVTP